MPKGNRLILGVIIASICSASLTHVSISAQNAVPETRGDSAAQRAARDGKTVPLNVTTRAYDTKILLSAPVLTEEEQTGRALWVQRCAYCHDGVGQPSYKTMGNWIGAETVEN